jgi:hypothetical protein
MGIFQQPVKKVRKLGFDSSGTVKFRVASFLKSWFLCSAQEFTISNGSHQFGLENRDYFQRQFSP